MKQNWLKNAVVYQIYPRSFMDSNADGIGDIPGIISRLDYLAGLGVNVLWLCPIFSSPMVDNGYDISDYRGINPEFGTLADTERLIGEADKRGIKILLDLVLNHTSDKHAWFQSALADPASPYRDFYFFRKGKNSEQGMPAPPNNWRSIFGGSAWQRVGSTDEYYFHLFAKEQPDLNWENPKLRAELYAMINWWMDKGVAGFRVDAISHIKKDQAFRDLPPDESDGLADCMSEARAVPGIELFLGELRDEVFKKRGAFTVAEANGLKARHLKAFIGKNGFFSTFFDGAYVSLDCENEVWHRRRAISAKTLRDTIFARARMVNKAGHGAPFLENHDLNRSPNRYLKPENQSYEGKTMLAVMYFFLQGTPFIHQGQELGMTNYPWKNVAEFDDVATIDQYERAMDAGLSAEEAFAVAAYRSRDNGRTPMLWNNRENAGFSAAVPWLPVHPDYPAVNVETQSASPRSVLAFYKKMIALRKEHGELFFEGKMIKRFLENENLIAYERRYRMKKALVICNFSSDSQTVTLKHGVVALGNHRPSGTELRGGCVMAPFEALVLIW
jgi:alpha-glucosidase